MNDLPPQAEAQARIDHIQKLYREWTQLLPKLEAAHQDWLRGEAIMRELAQFYFEGEYSRYHQALEDGLDVNLHTQGEYSIMSEDALDVNLHTQGEYSIMSEDALWNAFTEQQSLAWQRLRSAVAVLDRDGGD